MTDKKRVLLVKMLGKAKKASDWLARSLEKCSNIKITQPFDERTFDNFENLTSRFARHSDLLFQKVFRIIDQLELEPQNTLLDTLHRAAKRGFLNDQDLEEIRELRNSIAHEYTEEDLESLFLKVLNLTPRLLKLQKEVEVYCKRFLTSKQL